MKRSTFETICRISLACSKDETRPYLMAVHVHAETPNTIRITATDGHVAVKEVVEDYLEGLPTDTGCLIYSEDLKAPLKALKAVKHLQEVGCFVTDGKLRIAVADTEFSLRLCTREYPNVRHIFPDYANTKTVTVGIDAELLYKIAESLKTDGRKGMHQLSLQIPLNLNKDGVMMSPISVKGLRSNGCETLTGVIMPCKL